MPEAQVAAVDTLAEMHTRSNKTGCILTWLGWISNEHETHADITDMRDLTSGTIRQVLGFGQWSPIYAFNDENKPNPSDNVHHSGRRIPVRRSKEIFEFMPQNPGAHSYISRRCNRVCEGFGELPKKELVSERVSGLVLIKSRP